MAAVLEATPAPSPGEGAAAPSPLALVRGRPLAEVPRDLYIPPDALEVVLEAFAGPLDLLLYLIKRHGLDILFCIGGDGTLRGGAPASTWSTWS